MGMDLREIVLDALTQQRRSVTWLAAKLERRGHCSASTVHRWLSGRGDVRSTVAGTALELLGVQIGEIGVDWGTVRNGDDVVVCRVGGHTWNTGSWRVVHGTRKMAETFRSERLKALTAASRSTNLPAGPSRSGVQSGGH